MSVNVYQVRAAGPRGPGLSAADTAELDAAVAEAQAAQTAAETAEANAAASAVEFETFRDNVLSTPVGQDLGTQTPGNGSANLSAGSWVFLDEIAAGKSLQVFEIWAVNTAGTVTITRFSLSGGTYTELASTSALALVAGQNLFDVADFGEFTFPNEGEYLGFWITSDNAIERDLADPGDATVLGYGGVGHVTAFTPTLNSGFAQAQVRANLIGPGDPVSDVRLRAVEEAVGVDGAHPLSGKKVAIVGTSLVAQEIMPDSFATETGAIVQALGFGGGALGLDARDPPHYGSGQVTALLPSIAADTEVIILDMLVNDVAASDVPLGTVTDTTTATYYGALANFFDWCKTNRPNAAVCTVVQTAASATFSPSDYTHGHPNANGDMLEDFQNAHRRMSDYYGRAYIDPNQYGIGFLDSGEDTGDGLHWDLSGGLRIAVIYAKETRDLCEAGWLEE